MTNSYRQFFQFSFLHCRRLTVYDSISSSTTSTAQYRICSNEIRFRLLSSKLRRNTGHWNWARVLYKGQQSRPYGCGHGRTTEKDNPVKYFRAQVSRWTTVCQERLLYFIHPYDPVLRNELKEVDTLLGSSSMYMTIKDPKNDTIRMSKSTNNGAGGVPNDDMPEKRSVPQTPELKSIPNSNRRLSENIWTVPNLLCVARMGMAPVLGYMVLNSQFGPAIGLLFVAGITDLLDGWIARVFPGQSSMMGSFLDPMADKILIGTLFLSLTYINLIPIPLTALVIGRDAFLIGAGFYIRYQSLEPPRTLSRYFDVTSPSAQLAPTFISKVNTGVQLSLTGATLLSTIFPAIEHSHLVFIWYCTGGSTVLSALSYVFARDTYKVIKKMPTMTENKEKGTRG